jgi:hypothetical protein
MFKNLTNIFFDDYSTAFIGFTLQILAFNRLTAQPSKHLFKIIKAPLLTGIISLFKELIIWMERGPGIKNNFLFSQIVGLVSGRTLDISVAQKSRAIVFGNAVEF